VREINAGRGWIMAGSNETNVETILVVDDAAWVAHAVVSILEGSHFIILRASSGFDALKLAIDYAGKIDLLLSDVNMPGMSGPDLNDFLKNTRPEMRLMFMSGFAGGNLRVLDDGWSYLQRPLVPMKLVEMIQSVLHAPDKSLDQQMPNDSEEIVDAVFRARA
jgi:two-component system, cell cycle sensor histidine kinase and response regulator CckA